MRPAQASLLALTMVALCACGPTSVATSTDDENVPVKVSAVTVPNPSTGVNDPGGATVTDGGVDPGPRTIGVNFLFVHGVTNCDTSRPNAANALKDLEAAVLAAMPARVQAYQASHPGVTVEFHSARASIYTAQHGPLPSASADPLHMDDWKAGDGCGSSTQGDECTAAYEWRYRLAQEINRLYPNGEKNIILVGHSSGARASFEVAANMGADGVGTHDWGVADRIAGVVGVQGMVDSLGSPKYNVLGPFDFVDTCKYSDPIMGWGDSCSPGNGWCEYAGQVTGVPAANWVATHKHALTLTSHQSDGCGISVFSGNTDGSLPQAAESADMVPGLTMVPALGKTFMPAHGTLYGEFCHSTITSAGDSKHVAAVTSAQEHILDWLFVKAQRVSATGTVNTAGSIAYDATTPRYSEGATCDLPEGDDGFAVAGVCHHPGFFDGDDHAIDPAEFSTTDGPACTGSFTWSQKHDKNNKHAATFTFKTYSKPVGSSLISTM